MAEKRTVLERVIQARPLLVYRSHVGPIYGLSWSPDSTMLVSADTDGNVHVWDAQTGTFLSTCVVVNEAITTLEWSPDGKYIAFADKEGLVLVCEATTGTLVRTYCEHEEAVNALSWSPDSTMLVSSDLSCVHVWDVASQAIHWTTRNECYEVWPIVWSPDGRKIALSDATDVHIVSAFSGEHICSYGKHANLVSALAWSLDSLFVVSADGNSSLHLWSVQNGKTVRSISTHEIGVTISLSWSPDGRWLAAAGNVPSIAVYDTSTLVKTIVSTGHSKMVNRVAWSPNNHFLATSSDDTTVRVFQTISLEMR